MKDAYSEGVVSSPLLLLRFAKTGRLMHARLGLKAPFLATRSSLRLRPFCGMEVRVLTQHPAIEV
jgi:hypothetical protein